MIELLPYELFEKIILMVDPKLSGKTVRKIKPLNSHFYQMITGMQMNHSRWWYLYEIDRERISRFMELCNYGSLRRVIYRRIPIGFVIFPQSPISLRIEGCDHIDLTRTAPTLENLILDETGISQPIDFRYFSKLRRVKIVSYVRSEKEYIVRDSLPFSSLEILDLQGFKK